LRSPPSSSKRRKKPSLIFEEPLQKAEVDLLAMASESPPSGPNRSPPKTNSAGWAPRYRQSLPPISASFNASIGFWLAVKMIKFQGQLKAWANPLFHLLERHSGHDSRRYASAKSSTG
jgi:hypothetical protein